MRKILMYIENFAQRTKMKMVYILFRTRGIL